jgi:hypothetical protein
MAARKTPKHEARFRQQNKALYKIIVIEQLWFFCLFTQDNRMSHSKQLFRLGLLRKIELSFVYNYGVCLSVICKKGDY